MAAESGATQVVWTKSGEAQNYSVSRPDHPPDVVNICLEYLRTNYQVSSNHVIELGKLFKEFFWSMLYLIWTDKKELVSCRLACVSSNTQIVRIITI